MGAEDGVRAAETEGPTRERAGRAARVLGGSPSSPRGCSGAARSAPSPDPRGRGGAAWPGPPGSIPLQPDPARVRPRRPPRSPHPSHSGSGVAPRTRCCWRCQHRLSLSCALGTELTRVPSGAAPRGEAPCPKSLTLRGRAGLGAQTGHPDPRAHARPCRPPFPRPHSRGAQAGVLVLGSPSGCSGCVWEPPPSPPSQVECSLV